MTEIVGLPQTGDCEGGHGREVLSDQLYTLGGQRLGRTEVVLQVERVLRHPEWVSQISAHPLQSLNTLGAAVGPLSPLSAPTDSPGLTDVLGALNKVMLDHHLQQGDVLTDQQVLALLHTRQAGAVVGDEELLDGGGAQADQLAQALHLTDALRAGDARLAGLPGCETADKTEQQEHQHL